MAKHEVKVIRASEDAVFQAAFALPATWVNASSVSLGAGVVRLGFAEMSPNGTCVGRLAALLSFEAAEGLHAALGEALGAVDFVDAGRAALHPVEVEGEAPAGAESPAAEAQE